MNEDVLNIVNKKYGDMKLNDNSKEIIALILEELLKHEKVSIEEISNAGSGKNSNNLKIGSYILKIGETRKTPIFKNSSRILQPVIRRSLEISPDQSLFVEVQNEVDANWYKNEKNKIYEVMYNVYKDLRDDGLLWTDIRFKNIGKLLKDNNVNYTTFVHGGKEVEVLPHEKATGLIGSAKKILKAGEYVLLDTDFVFDINNLPDNKKVKDMLLPIYYENYEKRYQREVRAQKEFEK